MSAVVSLADARTAAACRNEVLAVKHDALCRHRRMDGQPLFTVEINLPKRGVPEDWHPIGSGATEDAAWCSAFAGMRIDDEGVTVFQVLG